MLKRGLLSLLLSLGLVFAPGFAAPAHAEVDSIVQLGDSYSAGNGAGAYLERDCWRSDGNYGAQVAAALGMDYRNVACSGGKVADLTQPRSLGWRKSVTKTYVIPQGTVPDRAAEFVRLAQADQLCGATAASDLYWEYRVVAPAPTRLLYTATVECVLTAAPQLDAVSADTDAIMLTIGGNDLGFLDAVISCIIAREAWSCSDSLTRAAAGLPAVRQATSDVLAQAYERSSGNATIYLVSYPMLLDRTSYVLPEGPAGWYDAGASLAQLQAQLDVDQQGIVAELNQRYGTDKFRFVPVKQAWADNGLDPRIGACVSDSWIVPPFGPFQLYEFMHPAPAGWNASAGAVLAAMGPASIESGTSGL